MQFTFSEFMVRLIFTDTRVQNVNLAPFLIFSYLLNAVPVFFYGPYY